MKSARRLADYIILLTFLVSPLLQPLPAQATLADVPVAWSNFTFYPVTYNGGIISDYESSSDPSRGTAAVNPANTDISSCSPDGYLPGNQPSFLYAYYDGGTPSNIADDYLALRMRLNATVLEQSQVGLNSGHWYILIDIDNDGWKEFALDIDGTVNSNRPDRVYLLYNDLPTNNVTPRSGAQRQNSDVLGGDEINLWYAAGPAATGTALTNNHVRVLTATPTCFGGSEFWLDVQVPMTAFNVGGVQKLEPGTPARFICSTSASAVDPLQKDWMLKLLSDPIFSDPWMPSVNASKTAFLLEDNDSNGTASPSDVLRYDVTITNSGLLPMFGVVFTDNVTDSNLKLTDNVTASAGIIVKGNNYPADNDVQVNIGTIGTGISVSISFRVTILNTFPPGVSVVSNQGRVSGTNFTTVLTDDPNTTTPNDATRTSVTIPPRLVITKEGPNDATVGSYITFTGTLTNYGTAVSENVTLVDQLPAGLIFQSSSHTASYDPITNRVTWYMGSLSGGASVSGWITVQVNPLLPDGTVLSNLFSVTWQDSGGTSYGPATATKNVTAHSHPQLSVSKTGPATGIRNGLLTFTLAVSNIGNVSSDNVTLQDAIPAGMSYVSSNPLGSVSGANVTWSLGSLASGGTATVSLTAMVGGAVPNNTPLVNNASVWWEDSGGAGYGPETDNLTTTIYTAPELTITKEGPAEVQAGSYLTFTGTLTNVGGSNADNVTLVDYLPPGLTFVGSSHTAVYDPVARTITWQLGTVGSGVAIPGWVTLDVDAFVPDGTELTNLFSVTWKDGGGTSYGPAQAEKKVIVHTRPQLSITKTGPAYGSPGGILTFNITATNSGGLSAQNVMIMDITSDNYTYISSSPPGIFSGGRVTWNLGALAAGATTTVSVTVQVNAGVPNGTQLFNGATVTWQDTLGNNYGPTSSSLATTIYAVPNLVITKTGPATANPSDNCTYTIAVTNVTSAAADNITLVDYLHPNMSYVGSSPSGILSAGGDNVTWNLGTITGGASRSVSITLQVDPLLSAVTLLQDVATATWKDNLSNDYGPASDIAETMVTPYPMLSADISGPAVGEPCDTLTFTVRITNTSATVNAQGVMAQYILPSDTAFVSASDGGAYANGIVTWALGGLAAGASRQVTVTITYCTLPAGSQIISPAAVVWQDPALNYHGPVFDTAGTMISTVTPPPPPSPPPPPPEPPAPLQGERPLTQRRVDERVFSEKRIVTPAQLPAYNVTNLAVNKHSNGHQVSVNVNNTGSRGGTYTVYLKVNGKVRDATTVTLPPNSTRQASWELENMKPGNYMVEVSSQRAYLMVPDEQAQNRFTIAAVSGIVPWTFLVASVIVVLRRHRG